MPQGASNGSYFSDDGDNDVVVNPGAGVACNGSSSAPGEKEGNGGGGNRYRSEADITPAYIAEVAARLASNGGATEECPICFETPTRPVLTQCAHVFCHDCLTETLAIQPDGNYKGHN